MRLLLLVLVLLTAALQYPLWWGKGGWKRVHELQQAISTQQDTNQALLARNNAMQAEVQDLKTGSGAVEERARRDLGLVKKNEIYVQILSPGKQLPALKTPELASPQQKSGN
ncbi:MAG: cell division protein FtsB [Candidimonas sp.]|nr:MAG: cell division protein FtsB [Candidimonas sp.]